MLGGTRRREGRRRVERTTVRKHGKGPEPCKPVNEMALDSRTGEEEAGNSADFDSYPHSHLREIRDQRVLTERISHARNRMRQ
jgi:hypothetical protein